MVSGSGPSDTSPGCSRHPSEAEAVGTLRPAQLQRSGTAVAETEQPLLREHQPLEMRGLAGAGQVSGAGGRGGQGGCGEGLLGGAHTQTCAHTPWHAWVHTPGSCTPGGWAGSRTAPCAVRPWGGHTPLNTHLCTLAHLHTHTLTHTQGHGCKHTPQSKRHASALPFAHTCRGTHLHTHTHGCTHAHVHVHRGRVAMGWCRGDSEGAVLAGSEGDTWGMAGAMPGTEATSRGWPLGTAS